MASGFLVSSKLGQYGGQISMCVRQIRNDGQRLLGIVARQFVLRRATVESAQMDQ